MHLLPPLAIAIPLLAAALLMGGERVVPRWLADGGALVAALATTGVVAALTAGAARAPIVYWFGGWTPRHGIALGVCFVVDLVGGALGTLAGLLTVAALTFSWHYFATVGPLFHALMLVFLAGMVGFCLTGDLFSLFVFFELMSVAAYALTGHQLEESGPLQGALNFAVTNSIGATLLVTGIALLYARTGALNLAQIGRSLAAGSADALIATALVAITSGLLVKAAVMPFHFAHADAHAVAPTPVVVLFSGVMLELGLYGLARIYWTVFAPLLGANVPGVRGVLAAAGVTTALLAAVLCFAQSHLKRLLAFSTISHVGLFLAAIALATPTALAGAFLYVLGHGTAKAALFLCVGILLHRYGSIDESELAGKGRSAPVLGVMFATGGLALAGLPPFGTYLGKALVDEASARSGFSWLPYVFLAASVVTGAAVLRAAGRVFLGWGPPREELAEEESEQEDAEPETEGGKGRIPWMMLLPAAGLLAVGFALGIVPGAARLAVSASGRFVDGARYAALVLDGHLGRAAATARLVAEPHVGGLPLAFAAACGAAILAAGTLLRKRLPMGWSRPAGAVLLAGVGALKRLHDGHVGDYVVWLTVGVAAWGLPLVLLLS